MNRILFLHVGVCYRIALTGKDNIMSTLEVIDLDYVLLLICSHRANFFHNVISPNNFMSVI